MPPRHTPIPPPPPSSRADAAALTSVSAPVAVPTAAQGATHQPAPQTPAHISSRSSLKKIQKIILACTWLVAKVDPKNTYKKVIEETTISLHTFIKDNYEVIETAGSREVIDKLKKDIAHLEVLLKSLVVSGQVKGHLYTFVHTAFTQTFKSLDAALVQHASSNIDSNLADILDSDIPEFEIPVLPQLRRQVSVPQHTTEYAPRQTVQRSANNPRSKAVKSATPAAPKPAPKSSRTDDIYAFIQKTGKVGVPQVAAAFTSVSNKTIQRELVALVASGRIAKEGDKRWTMYSVAKG